MAVGVRFGRNLEFDAEDFLSHSTGGEDAEDDPRQNDLAESRGKDESRSLGVDDVEASEEEEGKDAEDDDDHASALGVGFEFALDALIFLKTAADAIECFGEVPTALHADENGGDEEREAVEVEAFLGGKEGIA